jgi:hypothetical protein
VAMGYKLQPLSGQQQTAHKSQFISLCTMDLTLYIQQTAVTRIRCVDRTASEWTIFIKFPCKWITCTCIIILLTKWCDRRTDWLMHVPC